MPLCRGCGWGSERLAGHRSLTATPFNCYNHWANATCPRASSIRTLGDSPPPTMGSKRGRLLIRQPRVKKDSELLHTQYSAPGNSSLAHEGFQVTHRRVPNPTTINRSSLSHPPTLVLLSLFHSCGFRRRGSSATRPSQPQALLSSSATCDSSSSSICRSHRRVSA